MSKQWTQIARTLWLAGFFASNILISTALAQPAAQSPAPDPVGKPPAAAAPYRFQPNRFPARALQYYGLVWGVESLSVKWAESGEMIRFSYRVLDAEKAKALNDKKAEPALIDAQAGVQLVVPSLEQVGQLRQSSTPEVGKSYWMAFSNSGRVVKRGDRVDVVIGQFHANGLLVE
jgi:hypothetical protein